MEKITFNTEDGVTIFGAWNEAVGAKSAVLLLHMMPAIKESWAKFQKKLLQAGISSLAIDLRGHGESIKKGDEILNYKEFTDQEHKAKRLDVEAAANWMEKKGLEASAMPVAGASIGANLALQFAAEHPNCPSVVALSPGLNYRGLITMPLVRALKKEQRLFLAVSEDDSESANAVRKLEEASLARTKVKIFVSAGHGTAILDKQPDFTDDLVKWLKESI